MNNKAFLPLELCFDGSFAAAMSQFTDFEELEAVLATQEFTGF